MASKTLRKQITICGFVKGFSDMMWDQCYSKMKDGDKRKEEFQRCQEEMVSNFEDILIFLNIESKGGLTEEELKNIGDQIEKLRKVVFTSEVEAMDMISFVLDLIGTQFTFIKSTAHKYKLFEQLWESVRKFELFLIMNVNMNQTLDLMQHNFLKN